MIRNSEVVRSTILMLMLAAIAAPIGVGSVYAEAQADIKHVGVDPSHAEIGTVFYVNDPMGRNMLTFSSRAPLEDIIGTTNKIKGYVVFDPDSADKGGAGAFTVPVASLNTGIPLRDEHIASKGWLSAAVHPEIAFSFDKVKRIKSVKKTAEFHTYDAMLIGEVAMNGHSKAIEVPVRFTYLPESEKTRMRLPGDLLAGRAEFSVALSEFGVSGPAGMDLIGNKVSDRIEIEVSFVASTKAPEGMADSSGK